MSKTYHSNYIILSSNGVYYLFEKLNKNIPFEAYNTVSAIVSSDSIDGLYSEIQQYNQNTNNNSIPLYQIEETPYEVIFNV